jgi:hypothetical protein
MGGAIDWGVARGSVCSDGSEGSESVTSSFIPARSSSLQVGVCCELHWLES